MSKRENEVFRGDLTDKELGIIEDALEMSKSGDGREEHQKQIDTIIKKLYRFWEVSND